MFPHFYFVINFNLSKKIRCNFEIIQKDNHSAIVLFVPIFPFESRRIEFCPFHPWRGQFAWETAKSNEMWQNSNALTTHSPHIQNDRPSPCPNISKYECKNSSLKIAETVWNADSFWWQFYLGAADNLISNLFVVIMIIISSAAVLFEWISPVISLLNYFALILCCEI